MRRRSGCTSKRWTSGPPRGCVRTNALAGVSVADFWQSASISRLFFSGFRRRRAHLVAGGLERVALIPVRPLVAIGQGGADLVRGIDVLHDAVQLPRGRVELVAGLVVA